MAHTVLHGLAHADQHLGRHVGRCWLCAWINRVWALDTCLQALSENKGKKYGGLFRKAGKAAQAAQQHQHQHQDQAPPADSPAAGASGDDATSSGGGSSSTGKGKQQSSPGWLSGILGGSRKDKAAKGATAAVAGQKGADVQQVEQCHQQPGNGQQLQQQVLQLVSTQLSELTASICPCSIQLHTAVTVAPGADASTAAAAAGSGGGLVRGVGLQELQELMRQHDSLPEVSGMRLTDAAL